MAGSQIAVVGGGIAGLLAAAHVAAAGGQPVVFEAGSKLGGRARTRNLDGYCFNQGPHALYTAGALNKALSEFGVSVSGGSPDLSAGWAVWAHGASPLPTMRFGRNTDSLDEPTSAALKAFFARMAAAIDFGRGIALSAVLSDLPATARAVVEGFVRLSTYVHAPGELDAGAALCQLRLSSAGTIYVDGGWSSLVEGIVKSPALGRAIIRTNERVERVRAQDVRCWIDLKSAGSEDFGAVILAVPPNQARSIADGSAPLAADVAKLMPVRIMGLDLALSAVPRNDANFALGMEAPIYLSVHSAVSKLAPPGGGLVHIARYLAPGEKPSNRYFGELEEWADELQPGWRHRLVHQQRLSAATVAHDFPRWTDEGRRAGGALSDVPGVFLAGDWVGADGMLADAAAASARIAAAEAMRYIGA